jgi:hypothetical protein
LREGYTALPPKPWRQVLGAETLANALKRSWRGACAVGALRRLSVTQTGHLVPNYFSRRHEDAKKAENKKEKEAAQSA